MIRAERTEAAREAIKEAQDKGFMDCKTIARVKRRLLREARVELEELYEDFGDKMVEAMKPQIAELVEAEVARQGGEVEETLEFDASSRVLTLSRSGGGDLVADLSPLADGKE